MKTSQPPAFLACIPSLGGSCTTHGLRDSALGHKAAMVKLRRVHGKARGTFTACAEASPNASESGLPMSWESLKAKELPWSEVPFTSLQEELTTIDEYALEEDIGEESSWPKFLRAAAYEHWGQPALALAQLDLVDTERGLGLVPDYWLRRAYNAFKVGKIDEANKYHDKAERVSIAAVGNQLHFSFWFNEHFKNYVPRHNGPDFALQHGICKYCAGFPKKARESIAPSVASRDGDSRELQHAALWYLACSSRWHPDDMLAVEKRDLETVRPLLTESEIAKELTPIVPLFLDHLSKENIKSAEASARENGLDVDVAMIRATYIALYYDAFENNSTLCASWLDYALSAPRGTCTVDLNDFIYHAAKNRLGKMAQVDSSDSSTKKV